ncbi:MAG: methyltransferase domain-containing protein [Caldilineaceae bacterium]
MSSLTLCQRLYLWACERLYAEFAWSYDLVSWLVSWGGWSQWRAAALDHIGGRRVLEIGFGTGSLLITLAEQNYAVMGLEYSAAMHEQTAKKLARRAYNVPRVLAPAQAMPFANGSFDTILATFPSAYITEATTLGECARLLRRPMMNKDAGEQLKQDHQKHRGRLVVVMGVSAPRSPLSLVLGLLFAPRHSHSGQHDALLDRFVAAGFTANYVTVMQKRTAVYLIVADVASPQ